MTHLLIKGYIFMEYLKDLKLFLLSHTLNIFIYIYLHYLFHYVSLPLDPTSLI